MFASLFVFTHSYIRLLEDIQRSQIPTLLPLAFRSAKRPHTCTPRYPFGGFSLVLQYVCAFSAMGVMHKQTNIHTDVCTTPRYP